MPHRDVVNKGKSNILNSIFLPYCIFLNLVKILLNIIFVSYDSDLFTVGLGPVEAYCG